VLASAADAVSLAADQQAWLASGTVPRVAELGDTTLFRDALLDIHTLSRPYGVAVAGWPQPWRYVWPRDAAFVASALARTGHPDDAARTLDFLQRVQLADGTFHPRSTPDGAGPPDNRTVQYDATGWAAWALAEVVRTLPPGRARSVLTDHRTMLDRSTDALLRLTRDGSALPPASPDYWETAEREVTLASSAVLLMGLRGTTSAYALLGETARAGRLKAAADRYERVVLDRFAAGGFPRHPGGSPSSVDLGVALLMPPFAAVGDPRVATAWRASVRHLARPAGGLAPGGSWRRAPWSSRPATGSTRRSTGCGGWTSTALHSDRCRRRCSPTAHRRRSPR
jgi:hypothetical protein